MTGVPFEKKCNGWLPGILILVFSFLSAISIAYLIPYGSLSLSDYNKYNGIEFTQINCTVINATYFYQEKAENYRLIIGVQYDFDDQIHDKIILFGVYKKHREADLISRQLLYDGQVICYTHPNGDLLLDSYSIGDEFASGLRDIILGILCFLIAAGIALAFKIRERREDNERKQRQETELAKIRAEVELRNRGGKNNYNEEHTGGLVALCEGGIVDVPRISFENN